MKRNNGFTLVEIMLVIVILGILATIIVPMFSDASLEGQISALKNDLRKIRGQIELYKFHHDGDLPALNGEMSADFVRRMTAKTDIKGDTGMEFGPYLNSVPNNPLSGKNTVRIDGTPAGANTDGWRFDTGSGAFQADNSAEHAAY